MALTPEQLRETVELHLHISRSQIRVCGICRAPYARAFWPWALCYSCARRHITDLRAQLLVLLSERLRAKDAQEYAAASPLLAVWEPPPRWAPPLWKPALVPPVPLPRPRVLPYREYQPRIPGGCLMCRRKSYRGRWTKGHFCGPKCQKLYWTDPRNRFRGRIMWESADTVDVENDPFTTMEDGFLPPDRSRYFHFVWQSNQAQRVADAIREYRERRT